MEVEAKFAVPDARTFQRLQAIEHLADFSLSQGQVKQVRDTYLDTAKRAILASGYACRQRTENADSVAREASRSVLITLKGLRGAEGAVHRREELEVFLPSEQPPAHWPESPARDLVLQLTGDAPLIPLFGLEQTRVVRPISRGERPVAEFSLDRVRVVVEGREQTYLELEIELAPTGTEDDLCELVNVLQDEWRLVPQVRSKFERALAFLEICPAGSPLLREGHAACLEIVESSLTQLPAKPGLTAGDSMAEAARKTLRFHLQRMLRHEPGTRAGEDVEELHDMRVATRRMRAAIRVFLDYLDMDQMRPFVKGLRRTGRALGAVRDLDVFWEKTQKYLDTLPRSQQGDLTPLHAVWQVERERAREKMLAYLDSDRYARFKERFGEFLHTAGAGALPVMSAKGQPVPHLLRHVVPVAVYERLAAVRAYEEWLTGSDVPLERFHQLRIDAKGLRYTLEFFQEVLAKEAESLIEKIKSLQDHLGDLQDAVVASDLLRGFLTWGTWEYGRGKRGAGAPDLRRVALPSQPRHSVAREAARDSVAREAAIVLPGVASYLAARQAELQHLVGTFPRVWAQIRSPEFSRQVASVLATL